MIKISEAYIHLSIDITDVSPSTLRAFEDELYSRYAPILHEFRGKRVLKVRVEDGSLKVWISVFGGLYALIASYGSFREGIDYLVSDAKKFNEMVISNLVESVDIPQEKVYRIERRLAMPGKIQRLLVRIKLLSHRSQSYQHPDISNELEQIKKEIIIILNHVYDERDRQMFIEVLPEPISSTLPHPLPMPIDKQDVAVLNQTSDEALRERRKKLEVKNKKKVHLLLKR